MKKLITTAALCLLLCLPVDAFAQRGGSSSGGRSYSGGSSGSGGRSYSGGSSGGRSSSSPTPGRSYSGGTSAPKSTPAPAPKAASTSTPGKSYGGGTATPRTTPSKPAGWDAKGGNVQKQVESQAALKKAGAPKSTYTTPKGETRNLNQSDKTVTKIREIDHTSYVQRDARYQTVFQTYYARPAPTIFYSDPYNHLFYWWLLDRSLDQRAYWIYHHHDSVDRARLADMYAKDKELEARVRQLEQQKVARDANWTPTGVDHDLMFTDGYVNAAYNPVPVADNEGTGIGKALLVVFLVMLVIGLLVFFVFIYNW